MPVLRGGPAEFDVRVLQAHAGGTMYACQLRWHGRAVLNPALYPADDELGRPQGFCLAFCDDPQAGLDWHFARTNELPEARRWQANQHQFPLVVDIEQIDPVSIELDEIESYDTLVTIGLDAAGLADTRAATWLDFDETALLILKVQFYTRAEDAVHFGTALGREQLGAVMKHRETIRNARAP